jgi:hypothetical protein
MSKSIHIRSLLLLLAFSLSACAASSGKAGDTVISYSNSPDAHVTTFVSGKEPTDVARLKVSVTKDARVLIQFSSTVSAEVPDGCPCSIRAMVAMDGGDPRVIKRINVGSPSVTTLQKYQFDRQALDGSTVFEVPAGIHTFTIRFLQVSGESRKLEVNYPNAQAIVFRD